MKNAELKNACLPFFLTFSFKKEKFKKFYFISSRLVQFFCRNLHIHLIFLSKRLIITCLYQLFSRHKSCSKFIIIPNLMICNIEFSGHFPESRKTSYMANNTFFICYVVFLGFSKKLKWLFIFGIFVYQFFKQLNIYSFFGFLALFHQLQKMELQISEVV